jgi:methyl-accepting chemotaxis protein
VFRSKQKQQLQAALENLEAAENRVSELEADFQAIERSVAVAVMSRDGIFESASDVLLEMLAYQRQELIGQHHRAICESEYAGGEHYIAFWRELVTGHVREGRFLNLDGNGRRIWLESRYLPVMSGKGIVKRIILLVSHAAETKSD